MKKTIVEFLKSKTLWGVVISIVAMAAISFAFFYPDAAQGNVLRQQDTKQGLAVGHEAQVYKEATGVTPRWTNSLFSGMPTFQITTTYDSDSTFKWIDRVMGLGLPVPANLVFMMMVGFFILLLAMRMRWWLALIGAIAYGFSSYFIILIGAGHIWKFVTLAYIPPTIAGLILCYRGRYLLGGALAALFAMMQISSNHLQMTYYFFFVMFGFAVAYLCIAIKEKKVGQWAIASGVLLLAAVLAAGANLPSLYNTYEYSKYTIRGGHSELSSGAQSDAATSGLNRDYITQYSYGGAETFTLLIPNVKGGATIKPEKGGAKYLSLANLPETEDLLKAGTISPQEAAYLEYLPQYFGEPESTNGPVYVGALIVALFLLGLVVVRGPVKWVLLVLTIFSILLALGRNCMWLTDLMIDYMPMYSKFRTVESILVIAEFTMPLLAMMALAQILTQKNLDEAWKKYRLPIFICFGLTLFFCLIGILMPSAYGSAVTDMDRYTDASISQSLAQQGLDDATIWSFSLRNPRIYSVVELLRNKMVEADALRSFLIVAAGLGILILYLRRRLSIVWAGILLGAVVLGDLYTINKHYLDTESFVPRRLAQGDPFPMSSADRLILADTTMNYRVMDLKRFWQADPSYYHKAVGGYHAAKLTRYQDLIDHHLGHFLQNTQTDADWNVLNMLNAKYIVDYSGQPMLNEDVFGNAWFVDTLVYVNGAEAEMDALSVINPATTAVADEQFRSVLAEAKPKADGDTIFETSYAPDRLTYHTNSAVGGVAVLSEVYFPWGWEAKVDGEPVEIGRVNYLLRAVRIPAGEHTLELTFKPQSLRTNTTLAYVSVVLIYLLLIAAGVVSVIRSNKGEKEETERA